MIERGRGSDPTDPCSAGEPPPSCGRLARSSPRARPATTPSISNCSGSSPAAVAARPWPRPVLALVTAGVLSLWVPASKRSLAGADAGSSIARRRRPGADLPAAAAGHAKLAAGNALHPGRGAPGRRLGVERAAGHRRARRRRADLRAVRPAAGRRHDGDDLGAGAAGRLRGPRCRCGRDRAFTRPAVGLPVPAPAGGGGRRAALFRGAGAPALRDVARDPVVPGREGRADRRTRTGEAQFRRGAAPRRGGQPRQDPLPGHDEPRAAHAAQRHPGLLGGDEGRALRRRTASRPTANIRPTSIRAASTC